MKYTKPMLIVLAVILLFVAIVGYFIYQSNINKIDLVFYGTWVTENEKAEEQYAFTFRSKHSLAHIESPLELIELEIDFPDAFGFNAISPRTYTVYDFSANSDKVQQLLWCSGAVYNPAQNRGTPMHFAILDQKCIVFEVYDAPGKYFVCTLDPNADPLAWLELYKEVIQVAKPA